MTTSDPSALVAALDRFLDSEADLDLIKLVAKRAEYAPAPQITVTVNFHGGPGPIGAPDDHPWVNDPSWQGVLDAVQHAYELSLRTPRP